MHRIGPLGNELTYRAAPGVLQITVQSELSVWYLDIGLTEQYIA